MGRYFRAESNGNGDTLQGSIDELDIDQAGNGNIHTRQLEAKVAKSEKKAGNGNIYVNSQLSLTKPMAEAMVMWFNWSRYHSSFVGNHRKWKSIQKVKVSPDKLCPFSLLRFSLATSRLGCMHFVLVPGVTEKSGRPIFSWVSSCFFRHGNPGIILLVLRASMCCGKN